MKSISYTELTTQIVFGGTNVVAEETNEGVIRYIRGDRILASDSEHARTYYHYVGDELGSITHVTDENGIVLNRYVYDAFGNRTVCEEKIANRFGYAGEQYDEITQQYYLRARFYNPVIGRFTQEDTYYGDGLNLYEYGRNNPVRYIDPSGHEVRAAAEKNYVNRAVDAMDGAVDQGVDGILERVYGDRGGRYSELGDMSFEDGKQYSSWSKLREEGLSYEQAEKIKHIDKGQKPAPETYLNDNYIDNHLQSFKDSGAVKIMPSEPNGTIGGKGGTFVMSGDELLEIIQYADGNVARIENVLGLDSGYLGENPVIVMIEDTSTIRIPSGNELGAWPEYWVPGGYTNGGIKEAVISPVSEGNYTYKHLFEQGD